MYHILINEMYLLSIYIIKRYKTYIINLKIIIKHYYF